MTAAIDPTPLEEIEQRVKARAKQMALDLSGDRGDEMIHQLITEEVAAWNDDFRVGARPHSLNDPSMVAERALRNLTGYGPLAPLLDDDDVWEIMINGPDAIFVRRHRGSSGYHDEVFHDDDHVVRTLTKILDAASSAHRKLDPSEGLQDAQLDNDARVHIVHGDIARGGHLIVNIRKFTGVAFKSLDELVDRRTLTRTVADFLRVCVKARQTIVFAGAPGSGKTTMLSCCAAELDPELRVVVAEEVFEADIPLPNVASMQTRAARVDRESVDLRRLVAGFLRMAPDIAIVGEVRDREALPRQPRSPSASHHADECVVVVPCWCRGSPGPARAPRQNERRSSVGPGYLQSTEMPPDQPRHKTRPPQPRHSFQHPHAARKGRVTSS